MQCATGSYCTCNIHTHTLLQTWEQHGGYDFRILQHVNDATLKLFIAVGLLVATEMKNGRARQREKEGNRSEEI